MCISNDHQFISPLLLLGTWSHQISSALMIQGIQIPSGGFLFYRFLCKFFHFFICVQFCRICDFGFAKQHQCAGEVMMRRRAAPAGWRTTRQPLGWLWLPADWPEPQASPKAAWGGGEDQDGQDQWNCHAWPRPESKAAACEPGSPEPQDGKLLTLAAHSRWGVEANKSGLK